MLDGINPGRHWEIPLLFGTGLMTGFVDSIAGGGGLITLPVMFERFCAGLLQPEEVIFKLRISKKPAAKQSTP